MNPLTAKDVEFTLLQIAQATEAAATLHPRSAAAEGAQRDATALLQLWKVQESEAALTEVLGRLERAMTMKLGEASPSEVWRLLARKIQVAQAFVKAFREEQAIAAATARLIDDGPGV